MANHRSLGWSALALGLVLMTVNADFPRESCYSSSGADYYGTHANTTVQGSACINWMDDRLRPELMTPIINALELLEGSANHSWCRNPTPSAQSNRPWCYISVGAFAQSAVCDVPQCDTVIGDLETDFCYAYKGEGYRGKVAVTRLNKECANWDSPFLEADNATRHPAIETLIATEGTASHNFCRNPGATKARPWCYRLDSENKTTTTFDLCSESAMPSCKVACTNGACMNGGACIGDPYEFRCECPTGFIGKRCEVDLDECVLTPHTPENPLCKNGGVCVDGAGNYTCDCADGYAGFDCTIDIDECALRTVATKCANNGTCVDMVNASRCDCTPGWFGERCEIELDECVFYKPCLNGANCTDMFNDYSCACALGFEGKNCEINIDDCARNGQPCHETQSTCIDGIAAYTCQCIPGFEGRHCHDDINECLSSPCVNGACENTIGSFNCNCTAGYEGLFCEREIDFCARGLCLNGANCTRSFNNYTCHCAAGFTGNDCEINIDECLSAPCKNGATCQDGIANYTCACVEGYAGKDCEINIDDCLTHGCQNNATCVDGINGYHCVCPISHNGSMCETEINECAVDPCLNGATCEDRLGHYFCHCPEGFSGPQCQTVDNNCKNDSCAQGTCVSIIGGFQCICPVGFSGTTCEIDLNECENDPCLFGSTCVDMPGKALCQCLDGYVGEFCQTDVNECESNPCKNDAVQCIDLLGRFECVCNPSHTGPTCEEVKPYLAYGNWSGCGALTCGICSEIRTQTCVDVNGNARPGECPVLPVVDRRDTDLGSCPVPSSGDPCLLAPCGSLHSCIITNDGFSCLCAEGYAKNLAGTCEKIDYCAVPNNECALQMNAVTGCENVGATGYSCTCARGFVKAAGSMTQCDDVDECATGAHNCDLPLATRSTCINERGGFACRCLEPYHGLGVAGSCKEKRLMNNTNFTVVQPSDFLVSPLVFAPVPLPLYGGSARSLYFTQGGLIVMVDATPAEQPLINRRAFRQPPTSGLSDFSLADASWPYKAFIAPYWSNQGMFFATPTAIVDSLASGSGLPPPPSGSGSGLPPPPPNSTGLPLPTGTDLPPPPPSGTDLPPVEGPPPAFGGTALPSAENQLPPVGTVMNQFVNALGGPATGMFYKTFDKTRVQDQSFFAGRYAAHKWACVIQWVGLKNIGDSTKNITFQATVMSDFINTAVEFIYEDGAFGWDIKATADLPNYPVRVGYVVRQGETSTYSADEFIASWAPQNEPTKRQQLVRIDESAVTQDTAGRLVYQLSANGDSYVNAEAMCLVYNQSYPASIAIGDAYKMCPCTEALATVDGYAMFYESAGAYRCYEKVAAAQSPRCCYGVSTELLGTLLPSADGYNMFRRFSPAESTSTSTTLQAYGYCCEQSTFYCPLLLSVNPISTCEAYVPSDLTMAPPAITTSLNLQVQAGLVMPDITMEAVAPLPVLWSLVGAPEGASITVDGVLSWAYPAGPLTADNSALIVKACTVNGCSTKRASVAFCGCDKTEQCMWPASFGTSFFIDAICQCPLGMEGRYCKTDTNGCADNPCITACADTPAADVVLGAPQYQCAPCPMGQAGDGTQCADIDECTTGVAKCAQTCRNIVGSYECGCNAGYTQSGSACFDINECALGIATCDSMSSTCVNFDGGFTCQCKSGFLSKTGLLPGEFLCEDINECQPPVDDASAAPLASCPENSMCMNLPGAFQCQCLPGYELRPDPLNPAQTVCQVIDMCLLPNNCAQMCASGVNTYTCSCAPGFTLNSDGYGCTVDAASVCATDCGNGTCVTIATVDTCVCDKGFGLVDGKCTDIDECVTGAAVCDAIVSDCANTDGGYACGCKAGFVQNPLNAYACIDVNECAAASSPCDASQVCNNAPGSYSCGCAAGFQLNTAGTACVDVNECLIAQLNHCSALASCTNTVGGYDCACPAGFSGDGKICTDIDECAAADNGGCDHICSNLPGSRVCSCYKGYAIGEDGTTCSDVNECTSVAQPCVDRDFCTNSAGSFSCSCPDGLALQSDKFTCLPSAANACSDAQLAEVGGCANGFCTLVSASPVCMCNKGYIMNDNACVDVDECLASPCDVSATCLNTAGAFECRCASQYQVMSADGKCADMNECLMPTVQCVDPIAQCVNTDPLFRCDCPSGFKSVRDASSPTGTTCVDIDECAIGAASCGASASCVNTAGGFTCSCNAGFFGDGYRCEDVNECMNPNTCAAGSTCLNAIGSYDCLCNKGFTKYNGVCEDINECMTGEAGCSQSCTNTYGAFTCTCLPGFVLGSDGKTCSQDVTSLCADGHGCSNICAMVSGTATCFCPNAWWKLDTDGKTCVDVDECAAVPNPCTGQSTCVNKELGFSCECTDGYSLAASGLGCFDRDGVWAVWSDYSACSASCGNLGLKTRTRACDAQVGNGKACAGAANEAMECNVFQCPTTTNELNFALDITWDTTMSVSQFNAIQDRIQSTLATRISNHCSATDSNFKQCCPNSGDRTVSTTLSYVADSGIFITSPFSTGSKLSFRVSVIAKQNNPLCASGSANQQRRKKREVVYDGTTDMALSQDVLAAILNDVDVQADISTVVMGVYPATPVTWDKVDTATAVTAPSSGTTTVAPGSGTTKTNAAGTTQTNPGSGTTNSNAGQTTKASSSTNLPNVAEPTSGTNDNAWVIPVAIICSIIGLAIVVIVVALIIKRPGQVGT